MYWNSCPNVLNDVEVEDRGNCIVIGKVTIYQTSPMYKCLVSGKQVMVIFKNIPRLNTQQIVVKYHDYFLAVVLPSTSFSLINRLLRFHTKFL